MVSTFNYIFIEILLSIPPVENEQSQLLCMIALSLIDPEDILIKPLKCGYNPYTGEWSEWSTNPLKQKAITHYGMEDLVAERQDQLARQEEGD